MKEQQNTKHHGSLSSSMQTQQSNLTAATTELDNFQDDYGLSSSISPISSTTTTSKKDFSSKRCCNFRNLKRLFCPRIVNRRRQHDKDLQSQDRRKVSDSKEKKKIHESFPPSMTTKKGNMKKKYTFCPETKNLPSPETWTYRPLFIQPANDTTIPDDDHDHDHDRTQTNSNAMQMSSISSCGSIPIGTPIEFETPLFKGKILIRIRNNLNIDKESQPYFQNHKRLRQYVIQGQFKEKIKMSDIFLGDFYQRRFAIVPPPFVDKIMSSFFRRLAPGIIMDLNSDMPKVAALLAGSVQIMSIDKIGHEPDMCQYDMEEKTQTLELFEDDFSIDHHQVHDGGDNTFTKGFKSKSQRQKVLGDPKRAEKYYFHPGQVYTFNQYDDVFDLATYKIKIPMLKSVDLATILNYQPTTIRACTLDGRSVFNFNVFHEKLCKKE